MPQKASHRKEAANGVEATPRLASELTGRKSDLVTTCWTGYSDKLSLRWILAAGTQNMNHTQRWLAGVRPRHRTAHQRRRYHCGSAKGLRCATVNDFGGRSVHWVFLVAGFRPQSLVGQQA